MKKRLRLELVAAAALNPTTLIDLLADAVTTPLAAPRQPQEAARVERARLDAELSWGWEDHR